MNQKIFQVWESTISLRTAEGPLKVLGILRQRWQRAQE